MARPAPGPVAPAAERERFLLVRAGERMVGLRVGSLRGVVDLGEWHPVPAATKALRGVMPVADGLIPLFHLSTALRGGGCPATRGEMVVLVETDGRLVGYEVDGASEVAIGAVHAPPPDLGLPGAVGVADLAGRFVPLIDGAVLAQTLLEGGTVA